MKDKIFAFFRKWLLFFLNPRLLLCFFLGWMLTNGWSYLFALFGQGWVRAVGLAWLAFLWLPFTPEKIVTVALAIFFLRIFFPQDEKTLAVLKEKFKEAKAALSRMRENRRARKEEGKKKKAEDREAD